MIRASSQRGNAILFSLILIASALVITLGMTSVVVAEIQNAGLVSPAERAYYKAESYVEQALWNKRVDPSYSVNKFEELNTDTVRSPFTTTDPESPCARESAVFSAGCFSSGPRDVTIPQGGAATDNGVLLDFLASTGPGDSLGVKVARDGVKQFDVETNKSGLNVGQPATVTLANVAQTGGFGPVQQLEITVAAFPTSVTATSPSFLGAAPSSRTPVFIDKILATVNPLNGTITVPIGDTTRANPLGERYPALPGYTYRLRIKALGADFTFVPSAQLQDGTSLNLLTPDFNVQSVAQDGQSLRGIRVVAPVAESTAGIFDYVLFSDLSIDKLKAKQPSTARTRVIGSTVRRLPNSSLANTCFAGNTTMPGINNVGVQLSSSSATVATKRTASVGTEQGIANFSISDGVSTTADYQVSVDPATVPAGYQLCSTTAQTSAADVTQQNQSSTHNFYLLPLCRTVTTPYQVWQVIGTRTETYPYTGWGVTGTERYHAWDEHVGGDHWENDVHPHPPNSYTYEYYHRYRYDLRRDNKRGWFVETWRRVYLTRDTYGPVTLIGTRQVDVYGYVTYYSSSTACTP